MNKKIFFTIFGIVLIFGIALVSTAKIGDIKIESFKLDDGTYEYYIYKLSDIINTEDKIKKIEKRDEKINKKIIEKDYYENYFLNDCSCEPRCLNELEFGYITEGELDNCILNCFDCELEREYLLREIDEDLLELNKEKEFLNEIK